MATLFMFVDKRGNKLMKNVGEDGLHKTGNFVKANSENAEK